MRFGAVVFSVILALVGIPEPGAAWNLWSISDADEFLAGELENLEITTTGGDDRLRIGRSYWILKEPGSIPPRYGHSFDYLPQQDKFLVFGGMLDDIWNDTWIHDPDDDSWVQVVQEGAAPSRRMNHATAYDSTRNRLLLFGGNYWNIFYNDTWTFDPDTEEWKRLSSKAPPRARTGAGMIYVAQSDVFVIVGGETAGGYNNETWFYSPSNDTWWSLPAEDSPPRRARPVFVRLGNENIAILFGGKSGATSWRNDAWALNLTTWKWEEIDALNPPSKRSDSGAVGLPSGSDFVLIGGLAGANSIQDTWIYSHTNRSWWWVQSRDHPTAHHGGRMASNTDGSLILLLGGIGWPSFQRNKLWTFHQEPVHLPSGSFTSAPLNPTDSEYTFGKLSWTGVADPPTTRVLMQVAASNDNITWIFRGPDGSADTYYTDTSSETWSDLDGRAYVRIRVLLVTEDCSASPVVERISLEYQATLSLGSFLELYWWVLPLIAIVIIVVAVLALKVRGKRPDRPPRHSESEDLDKFPRDD